jgi:hypothetical protein
VIAFINQYGKSLGTPIVCSVMVVQVMTMLTGSDFLTMFLTHGLLVSLMLLAAVRPGRLPPDTIPRAPARREANRL